MTWLMKLRILQADALPVLLVCLLTMYGVRAESPGQFEPGIKSGRNFLGQAPAYSGMSFAVIVFRDVGWSEVEVTAVIAEASRVYARNCRFTLDVTGIRFIEVDARLHHLDEAMQQRLLVELGDIDRPIVFFIGATSANDAAYAYLQGTVSPGQGTAWLSRQATKQCRGPLLAHEIGHIALQASRHSRQPGNLMRDSCHSSNISNQSINTDLNQQQCQTLWSRYTP